MYKNYFKLAIKVLSRNRFFTAISLFGISFTLMVLMLISALLDVELGKYQPMSDHDKMVFTPDLIMKLMRQDTTFIIDSSMVENQMVYDTTMEFSENQSSYSRSSISFSFLDKYMRNVQGVDRYSFYSSNWTYDVFLNANKLVFNTLYSDAAFWQIYDFKRLEGQFFSEDQVQRQAPVAILTDQSSASYFGSGVSPIGQTITLNDQDFQVIGVVKAVSPSKFDVDVFIPYTHLPDVVLKSPEFHGPFNGVFMGKRPSDRALIQKDIVRLASQIPLPNPEDYNQLEFRGLTFLEQYAVELVGFQDDPPRAVSTGMWVTLGFLLLFLLLPTLNLINLNVSRILERSSEIGVRKAFGAHSTNIFGQLIFENIILTFIGGLIGLVLALILIQIINQSQFFPNVVLTFNPAVFGYSLLIALFFGFLSGYIPARRMSKIHIIEAIKN